ncbi:unnamed protein product [Effrenium voratum]|nr:unnamed protein product [Effrenium voratum]
MKWSVRLLMVTAAVRRSAAASEQELLEFKQDFLEFDLNKDNQIDAQEVRAQFKGNLDAKELHQFFIDVDKDLSGTISLQEYVDYAASLNSGGESTSNPYRKTAQWRAALACLAELRRRRAGSILSFNFALGALKSAGRWRQSLQLLAEVFWANLQATAVTFSSALCLLPWRRAASLLADGGSVAKDLAGDGFVRVAAMGGPWVQGVQSLERGGTGDPDAVINALLGSLTKAARWREGVTLAPKEVVGRNSLARAVAWPRSLGIVRTLEATCLQATTVSYNSALVNLRWTQGLMLLSKVEKNRGLRPSCVTYNTLVASATWRVALALASLARLRRASDAVTYNTAISGSEWRWALVVLDTLGSEVVALNAAASACEKASQWQQALALALGSADVVTWSAAEDMTVDHVREVLDGMVCRNSTSPITLPEQPPGSFNPVNFPCADLLHTDNASVHLFDVIFNYRKEIDFTVLEREYKRAIENEDLDLISAPFGLQKKVGKDVKLQMVILKALDGSYTIWKHFIFPQKCKAPLFMKLGFGVAKRAIWMQEPKLGRKIVQYCVETMGGRQFKCAELSSNAIVKSKTVSSFEDKTDEEVDAGFDFIFAHGPRSSSEIQQLRWMTKELRRKASPIHGWVQALVDRALRNLASDGALARKEFDWPIPLTTKYYHSWLLEIMEEIWDFDLSAFTMLGEAGAGKSLLGRSVLMAQVRHNKARFNLSGQPCIRSTPEIDFLRGEQGSVLMGDFLDDTSLHMLPTKLLKAFLDVGLYESMCWARWGATKWVQNEPRAVADNTYDDGVSEEPAYANTVSFETFFKLVKAGINTEAVPRVWEINAEYLTEEGKRLYGLHKGGTKEITDDFVEEVKKEDEEEDAKRSRIREQFFGERPAAVPSVTQQMQDKQKRALEKSAVSVTKEKFEMEQEGVFKKAKTWSLNMQSSGSVIDLDSSPQKVVSPSPVAPDHAQPKEATRAASSLLRSQESIEMDQAAEEMDEAWLHPAGCGASNETYSEVCLCNSLRSLGCPISYDKNGPFTAADGCEMLAPLGATLKLVSTNSKLQPGKFIVLDTTRSHFFAVINANGKVQKVDDGMHAYISADVFAEFMKSPMYHVVKLTFMCAGASSLCPAFHIPGGALSKPVYSTHMKSCSCGHKALSKAHDIEAVVYSMSGPSDAIVRTMRCTAWGCRKTYGPNFVNVDGCKLNTANPQDIQKVLFVNVKRGFSLEYLQYHTQLEFRAFVSFRAIQDVYENVYGTVDDTDFTRFRKAHADAIMYWAALQELSSLGINQPIEIGNELSEISLAAYDKHLRSKVFPPRNKASVTELVGDGHAKVHVKCSEVAPHQGKPRKNGRGKPYGHGWFMIVDSLLKILPMYKKVNCFVLDRNCAFMPQALEVKEFKQVKYWTIDCFHATGHKKTCKCNPLHVPRLAKRLKHVNTSAAEQVFAWFRNYARVLNESSPLRHAFKVLYYCKMHNQAIRNKKATYINQHGQQKRKRVAKPYQCSSVYKKPSAK